MDEKTMSRIFDPFFTTKEMGRGTGLGMASVYGIVKGHGGYIEVRSKKDHGASFSIFFPASDKAPVDLFYEPKKPSKGKGKILLVEDEQDVLEACANMMKILGYTVLTAKGGREAIEIYKEQKDSIDLILLDMVMPDMSGSKTFDALKEINPDVSVLLSSGYSIDGRASEILERGCKGFIQKPYNTELLSEKIKSIIEKG
jgi:two-component system cell cycle sensor histidine kinase/response regulator CckA